METAIYVLGVIVLGQIVSSIHYMLGIGLYRQFLKEKESTYHIDNQLIKGGKEIEQIFCRSK